MTAAIFALAGTLLGVLGTLGVELTRSRAAGVLSQREALRRACADFTAAVARMINLTIELKKIADTEQINLMRETHREARMHYERLRLVAVSHDTQKAGRYALRYAYGLLRLAEGKLPREDEQERGPRMLLQDSLMVLYVEVRREIGLRHAEDVYREPDEWMGAWRPKSADDGSS
jgi:hypothetical protein